MYNKILIFENISIFSTLLILFNRSFSKKIYYIYSPNYIQFFFIKFLKIFKLEFNQLNFKMIDIKTNNGQMIRESIPCNELIEFESLYRKNISEYFKNYNLRDDKNIKNYILKSIFADHFYKKLSSFRIIYLINVINQKIKIKNKSIEKIFVIEKRPCFKIYSNYASKYNIKLKSVINFRNYIKNILILLILILRNLKLSFVHKIISFRLFKNFQKIQNNNIKIFCEGKSQPNLELNGNKSDFFWLMNSNINPKYVIYNCIDNYEISKLENYGINTTKSISPKYKSFINTINKNLIYPINFKDTEKINFFCNLYKYNLQFNQWYNYFKNNNVKIFLNWFKYDSIHLPIHDAINELGGISTFFQLNFDGNPYYECKLYADINFCNSKFSVDIDNRIKSKIKYNIITGYPLVNITDEMIKKANKLRNKILSNGAKKIICVLDENSLPDERWHTGHQLQKDNYIYILEEMLKNRNLGVIFKPKSAYDLKLRLEEVNILLNKAILTGRCYLYDQVEENNSNFTKATPTLAALSSDLVIHSHLSSGTAAIETALIGKPTILIDREFTTDSIFYKILDNLNIYNNWDDAIYAINSYLFQENLNFGNWKEAVEYFDPFKDKNGSKRIGDFLDELIQGYNNKLPKNQILELATNKYIDKWGIDSVKIS